MDTVLAILIVLFLLLRTVGAIWYIWTGRQIAAVGRVFWIMQLFFTIMLALLFWHYGAFGR